MISNADHKNVKGKKQMRDESEGERKGGKGRRGRREGRNSGEQSKR